MPGFGGFGGTTRTNSPDRARAKDPVRQTRNPAPTGPTGPLGPWTPPAPVENPTVKGPGGLNPTRGVETPEPARPNYESMFQQSLDRQRASIDATLRQVMGDIDQRRAQGQQIVGMQPGEVNAIYDKGQTAVGQHADSATKSLQQAGATTPTAGQQAGVEAIRGAMEASRAGALADAPYLAIGANDLFNRQAGAAQMAAQSATMDLEAQRGGYYADRAIRQEQQAEGESAQAERARLAQEEEARQAYMARAATPAGTPRWWQANALVDPVGATNQANANIDPDTIRMWRQDPRAWQSAKDMLGPAMVSFLRFQYGLR